MCRNISFIAAVCFAFLSAICLVAGGVSATEPSPWLLRNGESREVAFAGGGQSRPFLVGLRARIVLPAGESAGAHALQLKLNGEVLTSQNAIVLNTKESIYDRRSGTGKTATLTGVPGFDAAAAAWYLKADADYVHFNDDDPTSDYFKRPGWYHFAQAAYRSHFYEYLLLLDAAEILADNRLEIIARLPEGMTERAVEVAGFDVRPATDNALFFTRPLEEFIFAAQPPALDDLLADVNARPSSTGGELALSACPGEYEPVSFAVYGLRALPDLTFDVELPAGPAGSRPIDATALMRYSVAEMEFNELKSQLPWMPEAKLPMLLMPIAEEGVSLATHRSQRFVLDVHVPDDQTPGRYTGTVVVRAVGKVLRRIPLRLDVHPFRLVAARQKYWMWRLTWSPVDEPCNVACLRDIKAHGFDGLAQIAGLGFQVDVATDGTLRPVTAEWERLARVLKGTGLSLRIHDFSVAAAALKAAYKAAGIERGGDHQWLADTIKLFPDPAERKSKPDRETANSAEPQAGATKQPNPASDLEALLDGPAKRPFKATLPASNGSFESDLVQEIRTKLPQMERTMVEVMQLARREAERIGLELFIFPVDEPDGTTWRRSWTAFLAGLAHQADLKVWSTHNFPGGWKSGIDESCIGGRGLSFYVPQEIQRGRFPGRMKFSGIPTLGRSRAGAKSGFDGLIDEVRVYDRALDDQEIMGQSEQPAKEGLLASYSFDEGRGEVAHDASGCGHDGRVRGAQWSPGRIGSALKFNSENDDEVTSPEVTKSNGDGWSMSLWFNGRGTPFGAGREFFCSGASNLIFETENPSTKQVYEFGAEAEAGFWSHLTISVNRRTGEWKVLLRDDEQRRWYHEHVKWMYTQIRGFTPQANRYITGLMAWNCRYLDHITTFCYDSNPATHLCVVYPEDGDRFANRPNTKWYGTLGWLATREGIDDARYFQTLYLQERARTGSDEQAWTAIQAIVAPADGMSTLSVRDWAGGVLGHFGSFDALRRRIVEHLAAAPR